MMGPNIPTPTPADVAIVESVKSIVDVGSTITDGTKDKDDREKEIKISIGDNITVKVGGKPNK